MKTFYLDFHVDYACRDSGACCSSGWQIPVETARVEPIRHAIASRRLSLTADSWLNTVGGAPPDVAGVLSVTDVGECVFHHRDHCAIHTTLGHGAMPSACQHFPRVCLIDPRGVFVTLSHYCPTAAAMLFDDCPANIVEGPPALPTGAIPEGLDAREALPPLLTPSMLMDQASYGLWEAHLVRVLTSGCDPEAAVDRLEGDAQMLATWRPGSSSLSQAIASRVGHAIPDRQDIDWGRESELFDLVRTSVAPPNAWPSAPPSSAQIWSSQIDEPWRGFTAVIGRFLAAHAFASWMAYQGAGLVSQVASLRAVLATLRIETARASAATGHRLSEPTLRDAIRRCDLLLRHWIDREQFARAVIAWSG